MMIGSHLAARASVGSPRALARFGHPVHRAVMAGIDELAPAAPARRYGIGTGDATDVETRACAPPSRSRSAVAALLFLSCCSSSARVLLRNPGRHSAETGVRPRTRSVEQRPEGGARFQALVPFLDAAATRVQSISPR